MAGSGRSAEAAGTAGARPSGGLACTQFSPSWRYQRSVSYPIIHHAPCRVLHHQVLELGPELRLGQLPGFVAGLELFELFIRLFEVHTSPLT